jgi:hypothetical protein
MVKVKENRLNDQVVKIGLACPVYKHRGITYNILKRVEVTGRGGIEK